MNEQVRVGKTELRTLQNIAGFKSCPKAALSACNWSDFIFLNKGNNVIIMIFLIHEISSGEKKGYIFSIYFNFIYILLESFFRYTAIVLTR